MRSARMPRVSRSISSVQPSSRQASVVGADIRLGGIAVEARAALLGAIDIAVSLVGAGDAHVRYLELDPAVLVRGTIGPFALIFRDVSDLGDRIELDDGADTRLVAFEAQLL